MKNIFRSFMLLLISVFILQSCGDTGPNGEFDDEYVINGVIFSLSSNNQIQVYLEASKDGQAFNKGFGEAKVDTLKVADLLQTIPGKYKAQFNSPELKSDRKTGVHLFSSEDSFNFLNTVTLPDSFSFEVDGLADNIVRSTTNSVVVQFTQSQLLDGYLIVVEPSNGVNAVGYAALLSPNDYSIDGQYLRFSIPNTAFRDILGVFKAGSYKIWMAAYQDDPINYDQLPFTLPVGFSPNINRGGVTGQWGALYIPASFMVTAEVQ